MTAVARRRACAVAAAVLGIAAPWLGVAGMGGTLGARALAAVAAAAGAFHGFGTLIAFVSGNRDAPASLRTIWGLGAYVLLAGLLLAVHALDAGGVRALVAVGVGLHALAMLAWLYVRWTDVAPEAPAGSRLWWFPAALCVAIAVLHTLAAAGRAPATWFDDDTHVLAQLTRLAETGHLADAVGYARESQLGGEVALAALVGLGGDLETARAIDAGLGVALVLALLWGLVLPRSLHGVLWMSFAALLVTSARIVSAEPYPLWITVALLLGGYATLVRPRRALPWVEAARAVPVALLAGTLMVLRHELAPAGVVLLVAATWGMRRREYALGSAAVWAVALAVATVAPYAVARALDRATVPDEVTALLARGAGAPFSIARVVQGVASLVVVFVMIAGVRDRRPGRPFLVLALAVAACLALQVSGLANGAYGWRFMLPLFMAWGFALVAEVGRGGEPELLGEPATRGTFVVGRGAYIVALVVAVMSIVGARQGPQRWWIRYERMFDDADYALHVRARRERNPVVGELLARAPADARVAIWLSSPEDADYRARDIIDLRTRRLERVARRLAVLGAPGEIERVVAALDVDYVLMEEDLARARRAKDSFLERHLCDPLVDTGTADPYTARHVICLDTLELFALRHRTIARRDGLRLVDARQLSGLP
jgi:hypothetical protein